MYNSKRGFRRHLNADIATKTRLAFSEHASPSGECSICVKCGACEIGKKAKSGRTLFPEPFGVSQFGAEKKTTNLEDVQLIPELYGKEISFHDINTETSIGGLKVKAPIVVASMGSTIVAHKHSQALAIGAARSGIPLAIGENVMITYGLKGLADRIEPYLRHSHKHGGIIVQGNVQERKLDVFKAAKKLHANAIEIKLGQGAKQGLGGEINFSGAKLAEKYKSLGFNVIRNQDGSYQRHASGGSLSDKELKNMLLKYSELKLPIWLKVGIGRGIFKLINTLEMIKRKNKVNIACLIVDGFEGGTGMSPWLIMNESGIASAAIYSKIRKTSFDVLLAGGYNDGVSIAKAMMLGARGVSLGRPFLIAANVDKKKGVYNYVNALKEELQMICATQKVSEVKKLNSKRNNLFALTREAAEMFGLSIDPRKVL